MTWANPNLEPWNAPESDPNEVASVSRRAAVRLWICGSVFLLLFGCCAGLFGLASQMPWSEFEQSMRQQQMGDQQLDQLHQMWGYMPAVAGLMALVGPLPGLFYLLLGFGVRAARPWAINLAMVVGALHGGVLLIMLLLNLVGYLGHDQVRYGIFSALMWGLPLALLVWMIRSLWHARDAQTRGGVEPWNQRD
ncbi:MAG: hypothetical protein IT442_16920 [Phycisphaeraceae bacterium]|nr:hypothetical protein [Phycisphaeraceae bacterium]